MTLSYLKIELFPQPVILNEIVREHSEKIAELIQEHRIGPELQQQDFDIYSSLINNEGGKYVEEFLRAKPPHSFQEYSELIRKYDQLAKNIPTEFERTVFTGLFEVNRSGFLEFIADKARKLKDDLVNKMIMDYQYKSRT